MILRFELLPLARFKLVSAEMLAEHFEEGSTYKGEAPLSVNWSQYQGLEDAGILYIAGAYDGKELVGYAVLCRIPNLFYSSIVAGVVQVLYLRPTYRKGRAGVRLVRYLEALARAVGCNELRLSVSRGRDRERDLFVKLGFKFREAVFTVKI